MSSPSKEMGGRTLGSCVLLYRHAHVKEPSTEEKRPVDNQPTSEIRLGSMTVTADLPLGNRAKFPLGMYSPLGTVLR